MGVLACRSLCRRFVHRLLAVLFCFCSRLVGAVVLFDGWQGAKVDVETALEVVEMYINTRGVGLAEAFENKCREEHGLPPNRR